MAAYIPMGILKEFKQFAMRGNVVDMAVGIVIGAAFTKIVNSLVNDVVMPPLGVLLGGKDFAKLSLTLREKVAADPARGIDAADAVTLNYGAFINAVVDFVIIAFAVFLVIKLMNRATAMMRLQEEQAPAPATKDCPKCCTSIPLKATRCPHCTSEI
jgi:large conductance mechanosensitive channel